MEHPEIKKIEDLIKRYKLPSFNELDNEFEINNIDKKEFLLREIRRKITERIEIYAKVFDSVLQIEPTLTSLNEVSALTDNEKEGLYKVFRKMMVIDRYSIEVSINETDEKTAEFIRTACKDWKEIKAEMLPFVKKIKESWIKETKMKEIVRYFG